jgi:molecular chaperone GrpE
MTIGDGPRNGGVGEGVGAGTAPAPEPDDPAGDDTIVDGEVLDEGPGGLTGDEVTEAEAAGADPLEVAQAERDEYLDSLRRLQAEFENYKKRVAKQQADQVARAAASLVEKLLPVLDALDLAIDHVGDAGTDEAKALVAASGLLHGILEKEGLERIDPLGEEFDPTAHEAVGHLPAPEGAEPTASGEPRVSQVMRAGYRWHGTVVRAAMVMVEG